MSTNDEGNKGGSTNDGVKEIKVKVDTGNMESILKRLTDQEAESKRLAAELKTANEEKEKALNASKTNADSFEAEKKIAEQEKKLKEEYEASLKKINDDNFQAQRKIVLEQSKALFTDEAQLKKIEESIKDPQSLAATTAMIENVGLAIKKGKEDHEAQLKKEREDFEKKLKEAESKNGGEGNIPMTDEMKAQEQQRLANAKGYDSHQDMIRDLRRLSHSDNPAEAAKAKSQLKELLSKWGVAAKRNFDGRLPQTELGPKDINEQPSLRDITKQLSTC